MEVSYGRMHSGNREVQMAIIILKVVKNTPNPL